MITFFILDVLQKKITPIFFVFTAISPENLKSIGQEVSELFSLPSNAYATKLYPIQWVQ